MESMSTSKWSTGEKIIGGFIVFALLFIVGAVITINTPFWGYYNHRVASNEVGVETVRGQFTRVVGPGVYRNTTLFADIRDVDVSAIEFIAEDPEVLTVDLKRIGLVVSGTVTRPGLVSDNLLTEDIWRQYQDIYTGDDALITRVSSLSLQAMKQCVGDRTFEEAAVGASRDGLRICIQTIIRSYAEPYHLTIDNVIVSQINLSPAMQAQLDQITSASNEKLLAEANSELASAQAETDLARSQGEIRVQQGVIQETERQQALTADLERQRLEAEQAVIEAQANNDISNAEYAVRLAELWLTESRLAADADLAEEKALAQLMVESPEYAAYLVTQAQAMAVSGVDFAYVPVGTDLFFMFGEDGAVSPVVDVTND